MAAGNSGVGVGPMLAPVGEEFQVNSYTTNQQRFADVAVTFDGGFVVVWQSEGSNGSDVSSYSVQGRRFASDGTAIGGEFQVNSYTTGRQDSPSVAVAPDGGFVVVWQSDGSNGSDSSLQSVQGQRFNSAGIAVGGEFQVSSYTTNNQNGPEVAMDSDGRFVVVWTSRGSSGSDISRTSIQGQRFSSDGSEAGAEFQINSYTTDYQFGPNVVVDFKGDFVVVWASDGSAGSDTSSYSVQGQRYDSDGGAVGDEFQINSTTTSFQWFPAVATASDGGFLVLWDSEDGPIALDSNIKGQRFGPDGMAVGGEFQVNSYTTSAQRAASLAFMPTDDFVVVWRSNGSSGSDTDVNSIQGQLFASDGTAIGRELQVNSYTTGNQTSVVVAAQPAGDFVVIWESEGSGGSDTSSRSIQGQRFKTGCTTSTLLCLGRGRFTAEVEWRDFDGGTGEGRVVPTHSDDSGLLYFFSPNNWEMLVKVLDGCDITDHFWVFAAVTTNVEYTLRVTDTQAGISKEYFNPLGLASSAITDTTAFPTCP